MAYYEITVSNGTDTGTVIPDVGFNYTDKLNEINEGTLKFSGTGAVKRGLLQIGSTVEIKRNGTRDFYGEIQTIDYMEAGTVVANLLGQEIKVVREKGDYTSSPYVNIASATIAGDIIGESSVFSAGTIDTGYNIDFRIATSQSIYNALSNLAKKTSQDVAFDYVNTEIDLLDHKGNSTPVATLNQGIDIKNMRVTYGFPQGNYIEVFGKGDGTNQIKTTDSDATSIATYGKVVRTVIDRSVMSQTEADRLAAAELALTKDPTKVYDFDMINPYREFVSGDHLYLNATDMDLDSEEVRIVGIDRGEKGGTEFMTLQVTNAAYKNLMKTRNKILAKVMKDQVDSQTYMQGSGNTLTWGAGINAKTGAAAKVGFYIPAAFVTDEANNLRIDSMTLDYDVDPFNQQFGTASFTGTDPQVQNTSGDEDASVTGDSGSTQPGVTGDSGSTQPDVSGSSDDDGTDAEADTGTTSASSITIDGSYAKVEDINPDSSHTGGLFINVGMGRNTPSDFSRMQIYVRSSSGKNYCVGWDAFVSTDDISGKTAANVACFIPEDTSAYTYDLYVRFGTSTGSTSESGWIIRTGWITLDQHSHGDGTYSAANHDHTDGSYAATLHDHTDGSYAAALHDHPDGSYDINAADLDYINIGDDVSEAGSVNATSVDIYLDFYDTSTGSWVNKYSITTTGKTLDNGVDITNGGAYPDAAGYWRVRIEPNNASPDFVQGRVNIKHSLDN